MNKFLFLIVLSLLLSCKNDENNKLHYQGQGEFSGLNIEGVVSVREGKGKFSGNEQSLEFQDLSLFIAGQQAQGQGKIFLENVLTQSICMHQDILLILYT